MKVSPPDCARIELIIEPHRELRSAGMVIFWVCRRTAARSCGGVCSAGTACRGRLLLRVGIGESSNCHDESRNCVWQASASGWRSRGSRLGLLYLQVVHTVFTPATVARRWRGTRSESPLTSPLRVTTRSRLHANLWLWTPVSL